MSYTGKIIKGIAGFYYVDIKDKGLYECKAKGLFRKEGIKPLVGDNAVIDIIDEEKKTGNIIDITERKNSIIRPACANIDLAVTVMSASKPKFKPLLMDKILIFFEYYDIDTLICFNKVDDASEEDIEAIESHFSYTGYELLYTSAKTGTGVDKLKEILKGKTSILTGPSGVGKSSLINNIFPHADMETGGMSKIGRGKHTTRHSEIFEVDDDTFILDTPGFTSMDLPDINKENVAAYFPEFVRLLGKCRFDSCIHIGEPGCAVKEALANGDISQGRYDSYVRFCEDIDRKKKY